MRALEKVTLNRILWILGGSLVLWFVYCVGYYIVRHLEHIDFSPLVPIPVLLKDLRSTESDVQLSALYQLSRYGKKAYEYLPELKEVYFMELDRTPTEIFSKNMDIFIGRIILDDKEQKAIFKNWHNEWVLAHPAEAAKRGYKVMP